jgi:hypothetical protein
LLACAVAGCDNDSDVTPVTPGPNQSPAIAIASNTTFGIVDITTFAFNASAADPDGNPVTVTWSFTDGTTAAGLNVWRTFPSAITIDATATVRDHTGATATSNVLTLTVGTGTGTWSGTIDLSSCDAGTKAMVATLTQSRATLSGSVSFPAGLCTATPGTTTIGADAGRILTSGAVKISGRVGSSDVAVDGQMTTTGQEINGTVQVGDRTGIPFTLTRQ